MSALIEMERVSHRYPGSVEDTLKDITMHVMRGETLGLIGSSGSGKSTLSRIMAALLIPSGGTVQRHVSPTKVQMVFQDSAGALNPRRPAWWLVTEPLLIKKHAAGSLRKKAEDLLTRVGLGPRYLDVYVHELSGGQRQRLAVARALSTAPELMILDEPTSALDVSVQALVLNELLQLSEEGVGLCIVSHDLHVVGHLCQRMAVLHEGRVIEQGPRDQIFDDPQHPYTQNLVGKA